MKWTSKISTIVESITSIPAEYVRLTLVTFVTLMIINIIKVICKKIYAKINITPKDTYMYNRKVQIISSLVMLITTLIIWEAYLKNFMTLISFVSAGTAIALRDIILNFFAGIYIRVSKPFVLEDRIEINDLKGDVANINASSFDILEIGDRVNGEQSTGRIVHVPNSMIFTHPLKNYVTGFKYIWNEITIKISLDSDIFKTKALIYKIVKRNSIIKETPDKMEEQIIDASRNFRIYFNNLEPIIYTSIVDDHIELYVRYLVHPKKVRTVENAIWLDVIKAYKSNNIELYKVNNEEHH